MNEMSPDHNTGNSMPYSLRIVCGHLRFLTAPFLQEISSKEKVKTLTTEFIIKVTNVKVMLRVIALYLFFSNANKWL